MPKYDPTGSALLSAEAKALGPDDLAEYAALAEDALGLASTDFTGAAADRARRAVALEVSHQLRMAQHGHLTWRSQGGRSWSYARMMGPDPTAQAIADELLWRQPASQNVPIEPVW